MTTYKKLRIQRQLSTTKLNIFEEIYDRIAKVESERKVIETRLESNDELIMRTFDDQQFKYESNEK